MKKPKRSALVERETILDLLTDDEASKVSTAETQAHLSEGDEYLDLAHLDLGVRRADGVLVRMKNVLPRKAVQEQTWRKIVALLGQPN